MDKEVYRRLARQLNALAIRFPAAQSGVELALLVKVFAPGEAALAAFVGSIPESSDTIAVRVACPEKLLNLASWRWLAEG